MARYYLTLASMRLGLPNVVILFIRMIVVLGSHAYLSHELSWQRRPPQRLSGGHSYHEGRQVITICLPMKAGKYIVWRCLPGSLRSSMLKTDIWYIQTITWMPICKPSNMNLMNLSPHECVNSEQIGC